MKMILMSNRGTKVWPDGFPETFLVDHFRCRFKSSHNPDVVSITSAHVTKQMEALTAAGLDVIKTENLYTFDGKKAFSEAQGG
jgi:isocitrate dehydrogenase